MMECGRVADLLPWLLNGTLEEGERDDVRSHLAVCTRCAGELEESAAAWAVQAAHPPSALLVDHAEGRPLAAAERRLVNEHLRECASCREQAELVAATLAVSLDESDQPAPQAVASPHSPWSRGLAAASIALLALLGAAALLWQVRTLDRERATLAVTNADLRRELETERRSARERGERLRELESRLGSLEGPRTGLAWAELLPAPDRQRGDDSVGARVAVDAAASGLVLVLVREDRTRYDRLRLELDGAAGEVLWRDEDLSLPQVEEVVVELPAPLLEDGRVFTLRLDGLRNERWRSVETYRLRVDRFADAR
jgi:hypothetical protein